MSNFEGLAEKSKSVGLYSFTYALCGPVLTPTLASRPGFRTRFLFILDSDLQFHYVCKFFPFVLIKVGRCWSATTVAIFTIAVIAMGCRCSVFPSSP